MRLGTLLLSATLAAAAQASGTLPWAQAGALPWTAGPGSEPVALAPAPALPGPSLAVHLSIDGALRITDDKGIIRLRLGLPGRPLKLYRDGGTPLPYTAQAMLFPARTPMSGGLGPLPMAAADFRPALQGLLWILDDDEKYLTVLHPATAQAAFLPLPGGRNLTLVFLPDRLEVREAPTGQGDHGEAVCWSVPWLAMLPQFIHLGLENPRNRQEGTVMLPFPKE